MQYWTACYSEIAEKIKANLPEIKSVDLWRNQVNNLTEELSFDAPAVFISFNTVGIDDRGKLVQDCHTQIDLYLFYKTFSDAYNQASTLEFLNQLTKLHALFHGKSSDNYSVMRRVDMRRAESDGSDNLYIISFQCLITDYSAQALYVETTSPDKNINVNLGTENFEPSLDKNTFDIS